MATQKQKEDFDTVRIPFLGNPTNRDTVTSKDQRFLNVYFDMLESAEGAKTFHMVKRPGYSALTQPPGGSAVGRGCYSWNGKLYSVFGTKIYSGTTDLGVTLTTSTGQCGFAEAHPAAGTQRLCINDGAKLYAIATNDAVTTITAIANPNTRDLIVFDRYWFSLKTNGTLIQSDLDDPTVWDASKIIYAQMYNGSGVGLAHQNNLIFCLGTNYIQAFFDAANVSGSVLTNVEPAAQQIGCASKDSISHNEASIYWVSNSNSGGYAVQVLDGTTQLSTVSTPGIERLLNAEGTSISSCIGRFVRTGGHSFYILYLASANRTLVYDITSKLWLEWANAAGTGAFPITSFAQHGNTLVGQDASNGRLYTISTSVYQDNGTSFPVFARFKRLDLNDNRKKFAKKAELIGDIQSSTTNVSLQYSDDDYVTLSTARTLDMSQTRSFTGSPLGSFTRRGWQITYTGANPLRLEALELVLRLGQY